MSDMIVDESRFIIDDELPEEYFFELGTELPDGLRFGEKLDETDAWQLYLTEDGLFHILAVRAELARSWCDDGYIQGQKLWFVVADDDREYALLICPTGLRLERATASRFDGSVRYAMSFAAAVAAARRVSTDVNLRDALFCEEHGIMLPCHTLVPKISDRALFENALRNPALKAQDLSAEGGLSFYRLRESLQEAGIEMKVSPWLASGESTEDLFLQGAEGCVVTGPLVMRRHYQIFDTDSSKFILLVDSLWAEALLQTGLVSQIDLSAMNLDGQRLYGRVFDKRLMLEPLDDRHFGLSEQGALTLAQAMVKTRTMVPEADLSTALYVQELGVLLPEHFTGGAAHDDPQLLARVLTQGPFSLGPLLDSVVTAAVKIVR